MPLRKDFATNIRGWIRFVPTKCVLASLLEGESAIASGVVSNISESGARLVTNLIVAPGRWVRLKLWFPPKFLVETGARIVWCREALERSTEVIGAHHGVEFHFPDLSERQKIRNVLVAPDFLDVWTPKAFSLEEEDIQSLLIDPDIERLFSDQQIIVQDEFSVIRQELLRDFEKLVSRIRGE